ncbi:MAG: AAA family ATPase [Methanobrevibacter sp.]|nr:AAA family ATPase [Methanobrevibacter sp.]
MKICVFITGTNAVGKTTLVKELIRRHGGIASSTKTITTCKDSRICLAGKYEEGKKFGGVDCFNQTKCLESVVKEGLEKSDVILCEGMFLHTFGLNLTRAAFVADKQMVVYLYAPVEEINKRLKERAGNGIRNESVWRKQKNAAEAARKWAAIGIPVLPFDTSKTSPEEIANKIQEKIKELCGESMTTN